MEEETKAKIVAQGDKVRQLKASGADAGALDVEVKELLKLKSQYKELTGKDYAPPAKAASKKKDAGAQEEKKKDGPSKNELKKAAKMAKNEAKKAAKKAGGGGGDAPPGAPTAKIPAAAPVPVPGAKRPAPSGPSLYCPPGCLGAEKVLAAAQLFGVEVEQTPSKPEGTPSFATGCVLAVDGTVVFGDNAVCKYFCYHSGGGKGKGEAEDQVEEWLEWEERVLSPAVVRLQAGKGGGGATDEPRAALSHLEGQLKGDFLVGASLSLADVVVAATAKTALQLLGDGASCPAAASFAKRVTDGDVFARARQAAAQGEALSGGGGGEDDEAGLSSALSKLFTRAMLKAFPAVAGAGHAEALIARCNNYANGDFQCNSPMGVFKALKGTLGGAANPAAVARAIVDSLSPSEMVASTSVAPAGFINIRLRPEFIRRRIAEVIKTGPPPPTAARPLTVAVDFSSPNIAKEMHVGHLRSTIIGDAICRILEFCGHTVHRINHVGDWGTQFGMLINYLKEAFPDFLDNPPNISDLTSFYKAAKARFDESDEFKDVSRKTVVALQSGDPDCKKVWNLLCDISRKEFQKVYDRLGVVVHECGESFYNARIPAVLEEMEAKGIVEQKDGAAMVMLPHFTYPLIMRKSDGGFGYDSTDMAAVKYRLGELGCDWVIYVTDAGQASHFEMVFDAAKACGWLKDEARLAHIGFGVVQGDDGKKFKTRSGETVRLVDLLDEAVVRMKANIIKRAEEGKGEVAEVDHTAAAIGYGAVKFFDLRQNPMTAYVFSYDRMLDTRGNTAVYLEFAHARLASILRKARDEKGVDLDKLKAEGTGEITIEHEAERALAFEVMAFADAVQYVLDDLSPNHLCDYVYALASKCTDFVTACKVLGSAEQASRLLLCEAGAVTMRACMELLGITPLYQV